MCIILRLRFDYFRQQSHVTRELLVFFVQSPRNRLAEVINQVAADKGWVVRSLEIASDHVHLLVEYVNSAQHKFRENGLFAPKHYWE